MMKVFLFRGGGILPSKDVCWGGETPYFILMSGEIVSNFWREFSNLSYMAKRYSGTVTHILVQTKILHRLDCKLGLEKRDSMRVAILLAQTRIGIDKQHFIIYSSKQISQLKSFIYYLWVQLQVKMYSTLKTICL